MLARMYRDAERRKGVRDRIRELWEQSGYTEEYVADHLGISISGFQKQKQSGGIKREHAEKLAELFGSTYDYIATGRNERGPTPDVLGTSQLDRIEAKLDRLIARLAPEEPEQVAREFERASAASPPASARKPTSKRTARATRRSTG